MAFERIEIERKQHAKVEGPIDWSGGMDLDLDSRALRSLYLHGIHESNLRKIHSFELAMAGRMSDKKLNQPNFDAARRFMMLVEMRELTGHKSQMKISQVDISGLCKWVLKSKPRREDFEDWHGVRWNHAWDWNSLKLELPILMRGKSLADELL